MTLIEADESWWQRWGVRLLPALTFLAGLALATIVVRADGPGAQVSAAEEPGATASSSAPGATSPETVVTVPGACEDASRKITEATALIDDVVGAVSDFQPQELVDLLNQLEDLDAETRPLAAQCAQVDVAEGASASPSASVSASPSATE